MTARARTAARGNVNDLRSAQLAAVASAIASDDKGVTPDDPRWTPTLDEARALVARVRALGERLGELERERDDIAKAADRRFDEIVAAPGGPLVLSAFVIVRRERDDAYQALARVRSALRAFADGDDPAATLRKIAAGLAAFPLVDRTLDEREVDARVVHVEDLAELAWGLIANASGGDWTEQSRQWREAATRWRDRWLAYLRTRPARTEAKQ